MTDVRGPGRPRRPHRGRAAPAAVIGFPSPVPAPSRPTPPNAETGAPLTAP